MRGDHIRKSGSIPISEPGAAFTYYWSRQMDQSLFQIIIAAASVTSLGLLFGIILSVAKKKLHVEKDPRIDQVIAALPGANCGACGFAGCGGYADKIVTAGADVDLCPVGGADCAAKIAAIMGVELGTFIKLLARVHCQGGLFNTVNKFEYQGPLSCAAAQQVGGGFRVCSYGCLGLGDCVRACPFDAITMGDDRLPKINIEKCTGCGKCGEACPRMLISLTAAMQEVYVKCSNKEKGAIMKEGCAVGCIGCKICVNKACKLVFADNPQIESAISVDNFLARVDGNLCINCGKCAELCPQSVITHPSPAPAQSKS